MFVKKSKPIVLCMVATTLMTSLIGCNNDSETTTNTTTNITPETTTETTTNTPENTVDETVVETPVDTDYFNIPWDLTTMDFRANNPDIRFGQDNGNDASTNEFTVEFFETGIEGTFSAFFINNNLIAIKAYIDDLMVDEPHPTMIAELESFFGETQYDSDGNSSFMYWENDETKVTLFTESKYDHMVNMLYFEKNLD